MVTPTSQGEALTADDDGVAANRVRFLTDEPVEPGLVRDSILASWHRSHRLNVEADQIELPYTRDPDIDTPLTRAAAPVLHGLRDRLGGLPVSIILTDPTGLVLSRLTADHDLERYLDRVLLAPGFSYAEEFVGTNGIGTALEVGAATHVFGHEHYAENLESLGCAGVPIHHPISGRTAGAIDLTCWRKDAGPLLLTLAKTTAEQIRQALAAETAAHQIELFQEYLRTCRRMTGVVFAVDSDVVMMNDYARAVLDPADQAALVDQAKDALAVAHRGALAAVLPSGTAARMYCRPVLAGGAPAGVVVHVKFGGAQSRQSTGRDSVRRIPLPGLVGSAPLWVRACDEVDGVFRSGDWLAVAGEPGVGKLALVRSVLQRHQPVGRLLVLDAVDASSDPSWLDPLRGALLEGAESVVVRHVDTLDGPTVQALSATLRSVQSSPPARAPWVAVTLGSTSMGRDLGRLLRWFPSTVEVPPLRLHLEDLPQLVTFFLSRLSHGGQLSCSPEAMSMLMRSAWPGNAEQVHHMLGQVMKHRRTGTITPHDLPAEARAVSRRLLSPLESMQRDAIVASLSDAHGNKAQAARSLGMSRATIYRKVHEYGIVGAP